MTGSNNLQNQGNQPGEQPPSSNAYPVPGYEIYVNPKIPGMAQSDRNGSNWRLVTRPQPDPSQGHDSPVAAVAYCPNGHQVVSLDINGTMILWDADQGVPEKHIESIMHGSTIQVSPDGRLVVVGVQNSFEQIKFAVWDLISAQQRYTVPGKFEGYPSIVISPADRPALLEAQGNDLNVWDLESGQLRQTLRGHARPIRLVQAVPNSPLALTASDDSMIKIWDVSTGKERATFKDDANRVFDVAVSADGRLVASSSSDRTLRIKDLLTGRQRHVFEDIINEYFIQISSDGRLVVSRGEWGFTVWDQVHKARRLSVKIYLEDCLDDVALIPGSRLLVFTMEDWLAGYYYMLHVLDMESGEIVASLRNNNTINCFAIAPSGKAIAIGDLDNKVRFLDLIESPPNPASV